MVHLVGKILAEDRDEIVLYYAPPEVSVHGPSHPSDVVVAQAGQALAEKVFERARCMLPAKLAERVTTVTGHQKPRHGIPAAAKVHRPDLIAVGARGASRFGLPRLGSVSRAVVHASEVPVLVARARKRGQADPLEILLCCARTGQHSAAGALLRQLSLPSDAQGQVIHVAESPFGDGIPEWLEAEARAADTEPAAQQFVADHDKQIANWKDELAKYCGELPEIFQSNRPVIREGHAGEQVVKYAESAQSDLIVVGAHAVSALARILMGSTSEYILTHASSSVLVVPHHDTP